MGVEEGNLLLISHGCYDVIMVYTVYSIQYII